MSQWDDQSGILRDATLLPSRAERGCPSGEAWTDFVAGATPARERETLLDHLAGCPDCSGEVRALREVAAWAREVTGETAAVVERPASRSRNWPWAAALAALILLPLLTLLVRRETPLPPAGVRGDTAAAAAIEPADGELLAAAPVQLRWPTVAEAREYRVQLLDGEGSLLWTSPSTTEAAAPLPADVRSRLIPGQTYLWRVETLLDGDRRRSPVHEFRLAP